MSLSQFSFATSTQLILAGSVSVTSYLQTIVFFLHVEVTSYLRTMVFMHADVASYLQSVSCMHVEVTSCKLATRRPLN